MKRVLDILELNWEKAGYQRPASRGLLEHVEEMPEKPASEFRQLSRTLVDVYYSTSFGAHDISPEELRELDRLAARLKQEVEREQQNGQRDG